MTEKKNYPQPHSIKTSNKDFAEKIHNAIKHDEVPRFYWYGDE